MRGWESGPMQEGHVYIAFEPEAPNEGELPPNALVTDISIQVLEPYGPSATALTINVYPRDEHSSFPVLEGVDVSTVGPADTSTFAPFTASPLGAYIKFAVTAAGDPPDAGQALVVARYADVGELPE